MTLHLHLAVELPFDVLALHTKGDDCVSLIEMVCSIAYLVKSILGAL